MTSVELFDWRRAQLTDQAAPLAARMRPRTLDEFIGQDEIIGPGRLLRRAIQADQLSSLIFYGPPGTGKTTLARIIANTTKASFIALNAVLSGVKDIRESIAKAKTLLGQHGRRTILFIDEVHRFNKAQQDALLPWVENGTVTLIGATTENPYFEVNKALVSRSRIFQLQSLNEGHLVDVAKAAIADEERGFGKRNVTVEDEAIEHLVNVANGDARALLNALELAVETTPADDEGAIKVSLDVAEQSIQQRAVLYDKEGDAHFDAISAFIKSCRGSDPDAALYWLARMVYAGEDPRFILRRMVILASEDVGLGDPDALGRVLACANAFDRVGMPEGRFHLSQAALVLATAAKSNSAMGFFDALATVSNEREGEVPNHLKDGNRDKEGFGHGEGYVYPHAYRDHWVEQQYLPGSLKGQVFYNPADVGYEATIREEVTRRREAQLAALDLGGTTGPLGLTFGPTDRGLERWLERASESGGKQLGAVRDALFHRADVQRHHVILDLAGDGGLLVFEAVRRAPEGGVFAVATDRRKLEDRARMLPDLTRPVVVAALEEIPAEVRFDRVIAYNALAGPDGAEHLEALLDRLGRDGRLVLAENVPADGQRLYDLVTPELDEGLVAEWRDAEEAVYTSGDDPRLAWHAEDLVGAIERLGAAVELDMIKTTREVRVTQPIFDRWWSAEGAADRPSYRSRLEAHLTAEALDAIAAWSRRAWLDRTVRWSSATAILIIRPDR